MPKINSSFLKAIRDGFFIHVFWPLLATIGSSVSGAITWLNYNSLIAAMFGFFAFLLTVTAIFLIRAAITVHQSFGSPENKLALEDFPPIVVPEGNSFVLIPRLRVINHGGFPIQVDSTKIRWRVNKTNGTEHDDKIKVGVVPPFGWQWLSGPEFIVTAAKNNIEETIVDVEVNMKYGKPKEAKFKFIATYKLYCRYYPNLNTESSMSLVTFERFA